MHRPPDAASLLALAACAALAARPIAPALAQETESAEMLTAFDALVAEVDPLVDGDPEAALGRYARALADGPLRGYGRLHLRMGQIHRDRGDAAAAAWHFRECDRDGRLDAFDREQICQKAYAALTAPLRISGLPPAGEVEVLAPEQFAGPFPSGARLPKGDVLLVVRAPGHHPARATVAVQRSTTYEALLGPPIAVETPPPPPRGLPRWPAYVGLGVGAVLVGAGVGVGVDSASTLDTIRENQRGGDCVDVCRDELAGARTRALLADGLWIGGATLAAGAAVWWLLAEGDE